MRWCEMLLSLESQQPFILTCLPFLSVPQLGAAAAPLNRRGVQRPSSMLLQAGRSAGADSSRSIPGTPG